MSLTRDLYLTFKWYKNNKKQSYKKSGVISERNSNFWVISYKNLTKISPIKIFFSNLRFKSEACIDACKDFDEIEWERNFRSNLSDTSSPTLEEYDYMTGSEKLAKWNPNHCDASYFPSGTWFKTLKYNTYVFGFKRQKTLLTCLLIYWGYPGKLSSVPMHSKAV